MYYIIRFLKRGVRIRLVSGLLLLSTLCAQAASISNLSENDTPKDTIHRNNDFNWYVFGNTEVLWSPDNRHTGWCNYLETGIQLNLWAKSTLDIAALANYNLNCPVLNDIQGFSNILLGSYSPFRLIQFGITQNIGESGSIFLGLRNTDTDYFFTPVASFFTGSSYTCFPSLSFNYPLATAPTVAMALHIRYQLLEHFQICQSIYNGVSDDRFNHIFRFNPKADGITSFTGLQYTDNESFFYGLGTCLTNSILDENEMPLREFGYTLWAQAEQEVFRFNEKCTVSAMLQGSLYPKKNSICTAHWGCGITCNDIGKVKAGIGVGMSRTILQNEHETDIEITARLPVLNCLYLQPSLHSIHSCGGHNFAIALRATLELEN